LARAVQNTEAEIFAMKTLHSIPAALLATGSAVVALLTLSSIIPADLGFSGLASLGIAALALFDYSRSTRSLAARPQILRPVLPSDSTSPVVYSVRRAA
jgi:hypothetical protein